MIDDTVISAAGGAAAIGALTVVSIWVHVRLRAAAARLRAGRPAAPALVSPTTRRGDVIALALVALLASIAVLCVIAAAA